MKEFWQAPGRKKLFNTPLKYWNNSLKENLSSIQSIAVLKFIEDNPEITVKEFKVYFSNYFNVFLNTLDLNQRIDLKESKKKENPHLFKTLLFCNFIRVSSEVEFLDLGKYTNTNSNDNLIITEDGKRFLNKIRQKNYESAVDIYLNKLFEIKYPNKATPKVKLNLYPFRIMFKLLSENNSHKGIVPRKMFITDIPFITKNNYKEIFDKLDDECYHSSLEKLDNKIITESYGENHKKWDMWIISSLIDMGILEENDNYIVLSDYKKEFIEEKVNNISFDDCFF